MKDRILALIPHLLVFCGFIIVILFVLKTNQDTKYRQLQGQTYARFNSCSLSFPPGTRTQADIDYCWKQAEQDTGVQVKIYNGKINRIKP